MVNFEASAVSSAAAADVFAAWIDVPRWAESEHIERASINGDFVPGAVIKSKARGFPTSTLVVTAVEPPTRWVDESRLPGVTMIFEHTAVEEGSGTRVTERVTYTGPLARAAAALTRRRLHRLLSVSTAYVAASAAGAEGHT